MQGRMMPDIWLHLSRVFRCDFGEYQDGCMENAEIHIYVGLKDDSEDRIEVCHRNFFRFKNYYIGKFTLILKKNLYRYEC